MKPSPIPPDPDIYKIYINLDLNILLLHITLST